MLKAAELSTTSYIVLGFLHAGSRSGYDIKQLADRSTRFFWQISYGQIYPELKRLQDAGLVDVEADPRGGRARHQYSLTPAGSEALRAWIDEVGDPGGCALRDGLLLKLFFIDAGSPQTEGRLLEQMQRRQEATLAEFAAFRAKAQAHASKPGAARRLRVLDIGVQIHTAYLEALRRLSDDIS